MKPIHINTGHCPKCAELFDRFPGFHSGLRAWFEGFQKEVPDAHISCAGRGQADQEHFFEAGTSDAHYGQSAHNYNAAIDLFRLTQNGAEWGKPWFEQFVGPSVEAFNSGDAGFSLLWYGRKGAPYFELPHIEVKNWQSLRLPLVE